MFIFNLKIMIVAYELDFEYKTLPPFEPASEKDYFISF